MSAFDPKRTSLEIRGIAVLAVLRPSSLLRRALWRRVGRQRHPRVARFLPNGDARRRESRVREVADGNHDGPREAVVLPVDGRPAGRTEMKGQGVAAFSHPRPRRGLARDGNLLTLKARLVAHHGSGAALAGQAVTHRDARWLALDRQVQLPTAARGASAGHELSPIETSSAFSSHCDGTSVRFLSTAPAKNLTPGSVRKRGDVSVVPTGADLKSMYRLSLTPVLGQQLDVFKLQLCSCLGQHRAFSTFKPSLDSWDRGDDLNKCHHGENHGEPDHATRVGAAFLGGGFDRNPEPPHCLDWSALALHAFLSDLGELVVRQFSPFVRHCSPPCPGYGFQAL